MIARSWTCARALAAGSARKAERSRSNELDLLGGFTLTNEQFRNGEGDMLPRETTGEGLFGFEWKNSQFRGIRLSTRLTAHPNMVQTGRYRIEYDSKAQVPLLMGWNWSVGLFDRYDSDPAARQRAAERLRDGVDVRFLVLGVGAAAPPARQLAEGV